MKPARDHLGSPRMHRHKMLLLDDCPSVPVGWHWSKQGDSSNWCYLRHDMRHDLHFWAVRNNEGQFCMGLMNHEGYIIDDDEFDTIITVLLTKQRLGMEVKLND